MPVQRVLDEMIREFRPVTEGNVATYIPELAKVDPELFAISVVALNGNRYSAGDSLAPFTIQSISKPLAFGLALEDLGEEFVLDRVGLEPTGDTFNAISLDPISGRPANPMVNAGAIAVSSFIRERDGLSPIGRVLESFGRYAGRRLTIDEDVYQSERETGHRNRAIAHLLKNSGVVDVRPEAGLDVYFQQCSISITCEDLAAMAACLANGGVNPITGERALSPDYVEHVLAVMGSCGMYDFAGEWIYRVGIPAKSGVSGGVLAVLPGQLGIGVYSPRLDDQGNSVRGGLACVRFSSMYGLHLLKAPSASESVLRTVSDLAETRSKRQRPAHAEAALKHEGHRALVYELQGELKFAAGEAVTRNIVDRAEAVDAIAIDFKHARSVDPGAVALLAELLHSLVLAGKTVILSDAERTAAFREMTDSMARQEPNLRLAIDKDQATEWAEDAVLAAIGISLGSELVPLQDNEFFEGLPASTVLKLCQAARPNAAAAGMPIVRRGEAACSVFLIVKGEASAALELPGNERVRVATYSAGTAFGEAELVGDRKHDYDVVADTDVEFCEVPLDALEALSESDPLLAASIFRNIARRCAIQLERANSEIEALSR